VRDVPEAWCLASVGEIADVGTGATPKRGNPRYYKGGTIPWITSAVVNQQEVCIADEFVTEAALQETNLTLYEPGTLLVAMYGEGKTRGKCAELRIQATTNQALAALVLPHSAEMSRKWIRYAFEYQYAETRKLASGGVQPNLNLSLVKGIELPFAPLQEQRRIEAAIESYFTRLDDAVATLSRVERNLKRYRASVLKSAVEGRLVPTEAALAKQEGRAYEPASVLLARILTERRRRWTESGKKGKYQEPAPPDTTGLPELPEGWCWATVEQIGRIESGQTPNGIVDALVAEGDIPWFRVGDMNTSGNEKFMTQCGSWLKTVDAEQMKIHVRPAGTILFPKRGGAIATNKKRRLKYPSAYDLNTMGVVPDESVAEYLWLWFAQVDLATLSDGSNVPQINHSDISPLCVPVPPIAEQKRIITAVDDLVSVADATRSTVDLSHTRAVRLRQAILKWAFEGKLADQDPSDEPASVLLERIKAERDIPKSAKKKSRA